LQALPDDPVGEIGYRFCSGPADGMFVCLRRRGENARLVGAEPGKRCKVDSMSVSLFDFMRWLQARGVTDDRLAAYRECAEEILREAGAEPVGPAHVEAARKTLEAAGRVRAIANLKDTADALRRFQGGPAAQGSAALPDPAVQKSHVTSLLIVLAVTVAGSAGVVIGPRLWPQPTASGFDTPAPGNASPEEPEPRRTAAPPPPGDVAPSAGLADASPGSGMAD
jgi:hypothetical protein